MRKRRLFWRLFPSFLLISAVPLGSYFLLGRYQFYKIPLPADGWNRQEFIEPFLSDLAYTAFWMTFAMGLLSWYLSRKISKPIEQLEKLTQDMIDSKEPKGIKPELFEIEEISHLANLIVSLNSHLNNRVLKVTTQKNEQEALFKSLSEGVVAISSDLLIKRMNPAAVRLLSVEGRFHKDVRFYEVIKQELLVDFIERAMASKLPIEIELPLDGGTIQNIKVNSAPYLNARSEQLGIVLVFSDITRLKQLEQHRKDFVANVSHELKTPLTSIQGYAETLLNPKMEQEREKQIEFIRKIKENSLRLKDIIDDLLYLSQLDRWNQQKNLEIHEADLKQQILRAGDTLKTKALSMKIQMQFDLQDALVVKVNEGLFTQAIVNLIDNALKYSDESKKVDIKSYKNADQNVVLEVQDYGFGIPKEDHERLFERFYRVDKGRARDSGGSGLGLAIVKNILSLHRVEISLQSELGKGSCFRLIFPK